MTPRRSLRGVALPASLAVLLLAACAGPAADEPVDTALPTLPAAGALDLPAPDLDLGTVGTGAPVTARESGSASVGFDAPEDVALIATLDCSACTGDIALTSPDRGSAWGTGTAPLTATYLVDLTGPAVPDRVDVAAEGDWTLTLSSSEDLTAVTGDQTGTGPVVLRLTEGGSHVRVTYTPAATGDELVLRVVSEADGTATTSGADTAIDQVMPITTPALIALDTDGSWSVQPQP